jgi:hypothetical protein
MSDFKRYLTEMRASFRAGNRQIAVRKIFGPGGFAGNPARSVAPLGFLDLLSNVTYQ